MYTEKPYELRIMNNKNYENVDDSTYYRKQIVDWLSIRNNFLIYVFCKKNHCWWLFYSKKRMVMTFLYEKLIVDDFSIRKTYRWRLFYMKRFLNECFLYQEVNCDDLSVRRNHYSWLFYTKRSVLYETAIADEFLSEE